MLKKCFACGVEKDLNIQTVYPYNGDYDGLTQEVPIPQLITVDCKSAESNRGFRKTVMCHNCFHRLAEQGKGVDNYIGQLCWESLNPQVPFNRLPVAGESEKAESYQPLEL